MCTFDSNVVVDTNTLFVDSVGNKVGIGTTNPGLPLEVLTGNGANYGLRLRRGDGAAFTDLGHLSTPGTEGLAFNVSDGISTTQEVMRISGNGNVGIGTNVPSSKLTVNEIPNNRNTYDHSLAPMTVTNRTATSNTTLNDPKDVLNLAREGTSGEAFGARATFKLSRYENSYANSRTQLDLNLAHGTYDDQNIMTMRSNGKVGIGTDAPGFMLDVNGTLRASGESRLGLGFGRINGITCNMNSSTTNLNYRDIGIVNGGATKFFIRAVKNGDNTFGNATFDVLINKGRFGPSNAILFNEGKYGRNDNTYGTWPDIQYQFLNNGSHGTATLRLNLYNANAATNSVPFTVTITCIGDVQGTIIQKTFVDEY